VLQVMTKLTNSNIAKEIPLVNAFEGAQEVADIRPHAFNSVAVNLAKPIAIIVTGVFLSTMTNGGSIPLYAVVALILIGVDQCFFTCEALNMSPESNAVRVIDHPQTNLPSFTSHCTQNRRAIIGISATSRCLLARRRGGSWGSKCSSPFFPRILEHLIALRYLIWQRRIGLQMSSVGL